ncbi:MAG: transposase [Candidatus Liptonbacteria bacterium]|nr:transposase [Candidatus Liptonbacteria bacterium]
MAHGLYEFNDANPTSWEFRQNYGVRPRSEVVAKSRQIKERKTKDRLVDILAFCLMPNHIHLLLRQVKDGGISLFMQKQGGGYAGYFNLKNERQGHLFQGRFKAIHIKTDEQLKIVFVYIHTNPAFLVDHGWKGDGIKNPAKVIKLVESYKWSSYQDYLKIKNLPSITNKSLFGAIMSPRDWQKFTDDWIYSRTLDDFEDLALE